MSRLNNVLNLPRAASAALEVHASHAEADPYCQIEWGEDHTVQVTMDDVDFMGRTTPSCWTDGRAVIGETCGGHWYRLVPSYADNCVMVDGDFEGSTFWPRLLAGLCWIYGHENVYPAVDAVAGHEGPEVRAWIEGTVDRDWLAGPNPDCIEFALSEISLEAEDIADIIDRFFIDFYHTAPHVGIPMGEWEEIKNYTLSWRSIPGRHDLPDPWRANKVMLLNPRHHSPIYKIWVNYVQAVERWSQIAAVYSPLLEMLRATCHVLAGRPHQAVWSFKYAYATRVFDVSVLPLLARRFIRG